MRMQKLAVKNSAQDARLYRTVSLAEVRLNVDDEVVRLPAGGFRMPLALGMEMSMVFPERMPVNYNGEVLWPQFTANSARVKNLAHALGMPESLNIELWSGRFDFQTQSFLLTTPEEASHFVAFIFDHENTLAEGLPAYMLRYGDDVRPLLCQAILTNEDHAGFLLVQEIQEEDIELVEILAHQGQDYKDQLQLAAQVLGAADDQQRVQYSGIITTLMEYATAQLDWGWRPMADFAIIYYFDGDGNPAEEAFYYNKIDTDFLCGLICMAEEAISGGVGEPKSGL